MRAGKRRLPSIVILSSRVSGVSCLPLGRPGGRSRGDANPIPRSPPPLRASTRAPYRPSNTTLPATTVSTGLAFMISLSGALRISRENTVILAGLPTVSRPQPSGR